ncbi:hypothetical protein I0C86_29020 [Plantactinospora sp. S1510]|uniref:Uncharacterized protein n=1 Tax=Plantactinospora alkalitolerans TaxID=2789879 RepID=A0ABS0H3C9_9ACTN|nr:hypothetical protein [Plantactinospora alkalitolerans]MBF9132971.1 hypothetical protein [Plantactinospora alkalitolerans]
MVTVLDPRRIRSVAALAVACVAVLPLTAACGGGGTEPPQWADGVSASESPSPLPTPTEVDPTSAPTPTAVRASRPAPTTAAPASRPRTMGQRSTVTVGVSGGMMTQSRTFTGLHQEGCGNPSWGLLTVRVSGAGDVSSVAFRYQVRTKVPFNGSGSARTIGNDRGSWLASLGPFRADPRNSAGGAINVTAEAKFKDGSTRTAKTTTSLKACRR